MLHVYKIKILASDKASKIYTYYTSTLICKDLYLIFKCKPN